MAHCDVDEKLGFLSCRYAQPPLAPGRYGQDRLRMTQRRGAETASHRRNLVHRAAKFTTRGLLRALHRCRDMLRLIPSIDAFTARSRSDPSSPDLRSEATRAWCPGAFVFGQALQTWQRSCSMLVPVGSGRRTQRCSPRLAWVARTRPSPTRPRFHTTPGYRPLAWRGSSARLRASRSS